MLETWVNTNIQYIAGIDEAGRGPLAGPVVAAAVVLDPQNMIFGLNDSKKLNPKKRDLLFQEIHEKALWIGVSEVSPQRIDEINILQATLEAMKLAFEEAYEKSGQTLVGALIDGNQKANLPANIKQHTIVKGDSLFPSIMAASIVAKVTRDQIIDKAAITYPPYAFDTHKGYGTKAHLEALQKYGPCPIHRRTFAPIKNMYDNAS